MKLFFDLIQEAPEDWVHVIDIEEAKDLLKAEYISDLSVYYDSHNDDSCELVMWVAEHHSELPNVPDVVCHSRIPFFAKKPILEAILEVKKLKV